MLLAVSLTLLASTSSVLAQQTPLASLRFTYPNIPQKVDPNDGPRGIQTGFNVCNSTTETQTSYCQTSWVNSIDDFCLWAPPDFSVVAEEEGEMVAWCTKPGHGTRLIPPGALQGVQWLRMPNYIQITGFINQTMVNLQGDDYGGELDPHGADQRGNPLGGIVFSSAFNATTGSASINGSTINQVIEWTNFMGANVFCLKACDPAWAGGPRQCEHIYDRIGCAYNAPSTNKIGTFEECKADNALNPGLFVVNGVTSTYSQPPESLGAISTIPYVAAVPSSSACTTYSSNQLYRTVSTSTTVSSATPTGSSGAVATGSAASGSRTASGGSAASAGATGTSSGSANRAQLSAAAAIALFSFLLVAR